MHDKQRLPISTKGFFCFYIFQISGNECVLLFKQKKINFIGKMGIINIKNIPALDSSEDNEIIGDFSFIF